MRGVRAIEEEHADEHQHYHAQAGENHTRHAELAIVEVHQTDHPSQTHYKPDELPQQEDVSITVQLLCRDSGSAEDHDDADEAQRECDAEELAVGLEAARHLYLFLEAA